MALESGEEPAAAGDSGRRVWAAILEEVFRLVALAFVAGGVVQIVVRDRVGAALLRAGEPGREAFRLLYPERERMPGEWLYARSWLFGVWMGSWCIAIGVLAFAFA